MLKATDEEIEEVREYFEWCCHGNWLVSAAGGE